jgi:hypothetical protein
VDVITIVDVIGVMRRNRCTKSARLPCRNAGTMPPRGRCLHMAGIMSALIRAKEPWGWGVPGVFSLVQFPWVCS